MSLVVVETGELAGVVREPGWLDDHAAGSNAILIRDDPAEPDAAMCQWMTQQPVPVLSRSRSLATHVDLDLADGPIEPVMEAIGANPTASAVCCQVSRVTSMLNLVDALRVESLAYATLQGGEEFKTWLSSQAVSGHGRKSFASTEPVKLVRNGSVLVITLNRPENRNALSAEMRDGLTAAFRLVGLDESIRQVRVEAAGPDFCSGGALDEFGVTPDTARAHEIRQLRMPAASLVAVADRTEFLLKGSCVGAGIELPAFGQRLTARRDTSFRLPEVSMGLIPGAGGCVSIPRRIGRQAFNRLAITGTEMSAEDALACGLIDEITG